MATYWTILHVEGMLPPSADVDDRHVGSARCGFLNFLTKVIFILDLIRVGFWMTSFNDRSFPNTALNFVSLFLLQFLLSAAFDARAGEYSVEPL